MKPSLAILILVLAGLLACSDDEVLPLTPDLVSEIHAYDLDNNGNSSDIRVDFVINDNLNVIEYRIMIVPSGFSTSFDNTDAASIPKTGYFEIDPEVFKNDHSIKRLPSSLLDVNGEQIQSNLEYVAAVFVLGVSNNQLSEFSGAFTLRDQPIYSGWYTIGWEESCANKETGAMSSDNSPLDGSRFVEVRDRDVEHFNLYEGVEIQCQNVRRVKIFKGYSPLDWTEPPL